MPTGTRGEASQRVAFHLDVHLHLMTDPLRDATLMVDETVGVCDCLVASRGKGSSEKRGGAGKLLSFFVVCGLVGFAAAFAYKAGSAAGGADQAGYGARDDARVASLPEVSAARPESWLSKELQKPPRVTPPPGAPAAGEVAGPSAFGLN